MRAAAPPRLPCGRISRSREERHRPARSGRTARGSGIIAISNILLSCHGGVCVEGIELEVYLLVDAFFALNAIVLANSTHLPAPVSLDELAARACKRTHARAISVSHVCADEAVLLFVGFAGTE